MSQTRNRRRTSTRSSSGRSRQEYGEKQRRTKKNNEIDEIESLMETLRYIKITEEIYSSIYDKKD